MYKRALVPLDGSRLAEAVIPFIVAIAGPLDMAIVLLRVIEPIPMMAEVPRDVIEDDVQVLVRDAEEYLGSLAAELRTRGITASWDVRRGPVADAIVTAATAAGADVIAMSTHGRSGLGRLLFGSVAEQVLRHADVPVFLIRQTEAQVAAHVTTELVR